MTIIWNHRMTSQYVDVFKVSSTPKDVFYLTAGQMTPDVANPDEPTVDPMAQLVMTRQSLEKLHTLIGYMLEGEKT